MKNLPALIAAGAIALSAGAHAAESSPSEFRGYQACLEANADAFEGLVTERNYLLSEQPSSRIYYINATAWENGERVEIGFSCETTKFGRLLENKGATYARFVPESDTRVQVASN